jgi:hypothetical protein
MKPHDLLSDDLRRLLPEALALPDAPANWVQRAQAAFAAAVPARPMLQRLQALLRFDSWAQPAMATALRRGPTSDRHLIFTTPEGEVELRITPDRQGATVSGQLLAAVEAGSVLVSLSADDDGAADRADRQLMTELGEFHYEAVAAGHLRLTLWWAHQAIGLPGIDVPPALTT